MPKAYEREVERRLKEKFDRNPKQNRLLKECIKEGNVIDEDVQKCINGMIEPKWKQQEGRRYETKRERNSSKSR